MIRTRISRPLKKRALGKRAGRRKTVIAVIAMTAALVLAVACLAIGPDAIAGLAGNALGGRAMRTETDTLRTQKVTEGVLNARIRLNGALAYDDASDLPAAAGTITRLPVAGRQLDTGDEVYEADGVPVPLFHGERPFWRTLEVGVSDGPDVAQLERNLQELGFYSGEIGAHFDWLTREAVRQWQRSLGLDGDEVTGSFQPGSVALATTAPIRITALKAKLGDVNAVPASYTDTALHVTATLTATQAAMFKAGDKVQVVLPDNTTLDTTLSSVDQGGQPTGTDGQTTQPSARVDFADQSQVSRYGTASVRLILPNTSADASKTLIVPVSALVASADGTYAVDVIRDGRLIRIPVGIGSVADAKVQIVKAHGLHAGDRVVVS